MAVDALLAQDAHPRRFLAVDRVRRVGIVGEGEVEPGVAVVERVVVLLQGALGVVAMRLHAIGGLRPVAPQERKVGVDGATRAHVNDEALEVVVASADRARLDLGASENREHFGKLGLGHLQNGAGLFVEELLQDVAVGERNLDAAPARHRHFGQGDRKAAVRTVVIRQGETRAHDLLHGVEERLELGGFDIGMGAAELFVNLGERRGAQRIFAIRQIHVDEHALFVGTIGLEIGGERKPHVADRRKGAGHHA